MLFRSPANFIVTDGNAIGKDVVDLIHVIQNQVKKNYKIDLVLEQEIVE